MVEGLFALWASGGERCEDLARLREDGALGVLIGHSFPAPQTARDFLEALHCRRCGRAVRAPALRPRATSCKACSPRAGGSLPSCGSVRPRPPPPSTSMP